MPAPMRKPSLLDALVQTLTPAIAGRNQIRAARGAAAAEQAQEAAALAERRRAAMADEAIKRQEAEATAAATAQRQRQAEVAAASRASAALAERAYRDRELALRRQDIEGRAAARNADRAERAAARHATQTQPSAAERERLALQRRIGQLMVMNHLTLEEANRRARLERGMSPGIDVLDIILQDRLREAEEKRKSAAGTAGAASGTRGNIDLNQP